MRALTKDELMLIIGAGNDTATTQFTTGTTGGGGGTTQPISTNPPTTPPIYQLPHVVVTGHYSIPPVSNVPIPSDNPPPSPPPAPPPPPPPCPPALPSQNRVDRSMIYQNEGGLRTDGYVLPGFQNSGVTIGFGVDLGYQTATTLANLGMSQTGIDTVTPFLGLVGNAAVNAFNQASTPPVISQQDAETVSGNLFNANLAIAVNQFNTQSPTAFAQLPAAAQTVIADIAYNSPNIQAKAPIFFGNVTSGHWQNAVNTLNNWTATGSDQRHKDLANLLQNAINENQLPTDSQSCSQ